MKIIKRGEFTPWTSPIIQCRTCDTQYQAEADDVFYKNTLTVGGTLYVKCPICECSFTLDPLGVSESISREAKLRWMKN